MFGLVVDDCKVVDTPEHNVIGPAGVMVDVTDESTVNVVVTVLSHPLTDVKTSVYVPAVVYVLDPIV